MLRSDHSSLTLLSGGTKGRSPMRLLRWAGCLSEYHFDVVYRPGADNAVADLLSRSEAEPSHETSQETATITDIFIRTVFGNEALHGLNLKDVAEATAVDDKLSMVVKRSINGLIPADKRNLIIEIYNRLADEFSFSEYSDGSCFVATKQSSLLAYGNKSFSSRTKVTPV